jgi:hypothetical protein
MNIVNVDLASEPITIKDCNIIKDKNYPFCLLGFQLKNSYDQARLILKDEYHAHDYVHMLPDVDGTPVIFRGIPITPKSKFGDLFKQLEQFNLSLSELPIKRYEHLLCEYDLTCKNCFGAMQKGVYPIDGECINSFAREVFDINQLYADAFKTDDVPFYQSTGYFTIFILQNRSIYRHGTDNLIADIVKNNP